LDVLFWSDCLYVKWDVKCVSVTVCVCVSVFVCLCVSMCVCSIITVLYIVLCLFQLWIQTVAVWVTWSQSLLYEHKAGKFVADLLT